METTIVYWGHIRIVEKRKLVCVEVKSVDACGVSSRTFRLSCEGRKPEKVDDVDDAIAQAAWELLVGRACSFSISLHNFLGIEWY